MAGYVGIGPAATGWRVSKLLAGHSRIRYKSPLWRWPQLEFL